MRPGPAAAPPAPRSDGPPWRAGLRAPWLRPGREPRDGLVWLVVVGAGLALTALFVDVHARVGTAAPPFSGRYGWRAGPATAGAVTVAVFVLVAARRRWHERMPWRWLLLAGYLASLAWALTLALVDGRHGVSGPVDAPTGYLRDVPLVGDHPLRFLEHFVRDADQHSVLTRQHPPLPVLALWALGRAGLHDPFAIGLLLTAVGCLSVPLVAVAVRGLCHEPAARRLLPLLALAPYALWVAVSMDAVTLTLGAGTLVCGVLASRPRRPAGSAAALAVACGLLLGVASLFSYSAPWLGWSVVFTYFVRRRAWLNVVTGAALLLPVWLAGLAGFEWTNGLTAAQADFSLRVEPHRSWLVWAVLDLVVVVIAAGPAVVSAARKVRRTPGWPYVAGAVLAIGFAVLSGLSRGEVERSLLPFLPWLLVPAVAPEVRPLEPGRPASSPTPALLLAMGAAAAVGLQTALRSPW